MTEERDMQWANQVDDLYDEIDALRDEIKRLKMESFHLQEALCFYATSDAKGKTAREAINAIKMLPPLAVR